MQASVRVGASARTSALKVDRWLARMELKMRDRSPSEGVAQVKVVVNKRCSRSLTVTLPAVGFIAAMYCRSTTSRRTPRSPRSK